MLGGPQARRCPGLLYAVYNKYHPKSTGTKFAHRMMMKIGSRWIQAQTSTDCQPEYGYYKPGYGLQSTRPRQAASDPDQFCYSVNITK